MTTLGHLIDGGPLGCGDERCDICTVPTQGACEPRAAYIGHLRAWFAGRNYQPTSYELGARTRMERQAQLPRRTCDDCGQYRARSGHCIGCLSRRRHQRRMA